MCSLCPGDFSNLPAAFDASSMIFGADVCSNLVRSVVINWGPVVDPLLLAANVTVAAADGSSVLPSWLSVRVTGSKIVTFSSDLIPAAAALNGTLNITLSVTHTCRSTPWLGIVSFVLLRTDPVLVRDSTIASSGAQACPDFSIQYTALLGTCASQTAVIAVLSNGSALPPFATYAFGNGILDIVGTVPTGTPSPFTVVGIAQLGHETFRSAETVISIASASAIAFTTSATHLLACPFVSFTVTATRQGSCGQMRMWASLSPGGLSIPPYLSTATSGGGDGKSMTMTIFGTVPENTADFTIVVSASVGSSGQVYSSDVVTVSRPLLVSNANTSLWIDGSSNVGNASLNNVVAATMSVPIDVEAPYGEATQVGVSIDAGSQQVCSSVALVASDVPPADPQSGASGSSPTSSPSSPSSNAMRLPKWVSVSTMSSTSLLISANPTSDVLPGTWATIFVWANDGYRNPGFNITIVAVSSLRASQASPGGLPLVSTPAPLLQMELSINSSSSSSIIPSAASLVLICPVAAAAAFCSYNDRALSLGVFGTPAGVNAVLQGLSISLGPSSSSASGSRAVSSIISNVTAQLTFTESLNPTPVTIAIPLSALKIYDGVRQIKSLAANGTVGKQSVVAIADFFTAGNSSASAVSYVLESNASWLSIQGGFLLGTPPSPPAVVLFAVIASDKYTRVVANGTMNVSWPMLSCCPLSVAEPLVRAVKHASRRAAAARHHLRP